MVAARPNIDTRGVVRRLRWSMMSFGGALLIAALLEWRSMPWPLYLMTALPFFGAFSLAYQGVFKTCTFMAADGVRDVGEGREKIASPAECAAVQVRARRVNLLTAASTIVATLLLVLASR